MTGLPTEERFNTRKRSGGATTRLYDDGRFHVGQPLSEAALAAEMGISRGPVREALAAGRLRKGCGTHSPNRGFSVVEFTEGGFARDQRSAAATRSNGTQDDQAAHRQAGPGKGSRTEKRDDRRLRERGSILDLRPDGHGLSRPDLERTGNSRLAATLRHLLVPIVRIRCAI